MDVYRKDKGAVMSRLQGVGAQCDICDEILKPAETMRLKGIKYEKGENHSKCSSDNKYVIIHQFHLCPDCYVQIVNKIRNRTI